jgi:hypothetical protein
MADGIPILPSGVPTNQDIRPGLAVFLREYLNAQGVIGTDLAAGHTSRDDRSGVFLDGPHKGQTVYQVMQRARKMWTSGKGLSTDPTQYQPGAKQSGLDWLMQNNGQGADATREYWSQRANNLDPNARTQLDQYLAGWGAPTVNWGAGQQQQQPMVTDPLERANIQAKTQAPSASQQAKAEVKMMTPPAPAPTPPASPDPLVLPAAAAPATAEPVTTAATPTTSSTAATTAPTPTTGMTDPGDLSTRTNVLVSPPDEELFGSGGGDVAAQREPLAAVKTDDDAGKSSDDVTVKTGKPIDGVTPEAKTAVYADAETAKNADAGKKAGKQAQLKNASQPKPTKAKPDPNSTEGRKARMDEEHWMSKMAPAPTATRKKRMAEWQQKSDGWKPTDGEETMTGTSPVRQRRGNLKDGTATEGDIVGTQRPLGKDRRYKKGEGPEYTGPTGDKKVEPGGEVAAEIKVGGKYVPDPLGGSKWSPGGKGSSRWTPEQIRKRKKQTA